MTKRYRITLTTNREATDPFAFVRRNLNRLTIVSYEESDATAQWAARQ